MALAFGRAEDVERGDLGFVDGHGQMVPVVGRAGLVRKRPPVPPMPAPWPWSVASRYRCGGPRSQSTACSISAAWGWTAQRPNVTRAVVSTAPRPPGNGPIVPVDPSGPAGASFLGLGSGPEDADDLAAQRASIQVCESERQVGQGRIGKLVPQPVQAVRSLEAGRVSRAEGMEQGRAGLKIVAGQLGEFLLR